MGRTERRNVCLSTNRCQGGSREAAAALNVAPRSGSSGVCESQDPPPSLPRLSCPRGRRAPVASRPPPTDAVYSWASSVSTLSHIRNAFPRRPRRGVLHSWDHVQPALAQGTAGQGFQMQE